MATYEEERAKVDARGIGAGVLNRAGARAQVLADNVNAGVRGINSGAAQIMGRVAGFRPEMPAQTLPRLAGPDATGDTLTNFGTDRLLNTDKRISLPVGIPAGPDATGDTLTDFGTARLSGVQPQNSASYMLGQAAGGALNLGRSGAGRVEDSFRKVGGDIASGFRGTQPAVAQATPQTEIGPQWKMPIDAPVDQPLGQPAADEYPKPLTDAVINSAPVSSAPAAGFRQPAQSQEMPKSPSPNISFVRMEDGNGFQGFREVINGSARPPALTGNDAQDKLRLEGYKAMNDSWAQQNGLVPLQQSQSGFFDVQAAELPGENASQAGLRSAQVDALKQPQAGVAKPYYGETESIGPNGITSEPYVVVPDAAGGFRMVRPTQGGASSLQEMAAGLTTEQRSIAAKYMKENPAEDKASILQRVKSGAL